MAAMQVAPQQPQPSISPVSVSYGLDPQQSQQAISPVPVQYGADPPSIPRRPYQPQSSPSADRGRSPSNPRSSPHSSKRPTRKPSNGDGSPQTAYNSPPNPPLPSGVSSGRAQDSPNVNTQSSPIPPGSASTTYRREPRAQQSPQAGPPISPPPRTSSNQRDARITANTAQPVDRSTPRQQSRADRTEREEAGVQVEDPYGTGEPAATQTRKQGPATANVREPTSQQGPAGGQTRAVSQVPSSPVARDPQDDPEVLNRKVVDDDPTIDLRREQERQLESVPGLAVTNNADVAEVPRSTPRSRQDYSSSATSSARRKESKFGNYILGQTLGEGEFGKVKLGWKKDGSVQVAIKLIRRESLGTNPSRLPKIHREIKILETLQHPNIVKLHEMVETREFIGIILEYASGGELFDYILNHRYLKDNTARKLFAQLVSGVGYLHKKGIVHRDLKLENLLLDRNRNIIITDFGFANTFDPSDELGEDVEINLTNRDYVKRMNLDRVHNGFRRGDLMATSCGSPCYAAPELVVTDSLYTGRKVDVWSCGVILYAMLAGYLPFDDDPANPEGDNINLLYKYITTTPLTFPEYVTPHARDLLRRILVPDPRKRADLFEVARHSWLSDYAHVVSQVTSSATTVGDISNTTVTSAQQEAPALVRSASVREPTRAAPAAGIPPVGGLTHQPTMDQAPEQAARPVRDRDRDRERDSKRRTVQVEYVAPKSQTVRGDGLSPITSPAGDSAAPTPRTRGEESATSRSKPPVAYYPQSSSTSRPQTRPGSSSQKEMGPPERPPKEYTRSASDAAGMSGQQASSSTAVNRPTTGSSITTPGHSRLPSRGNSYSQPLAPTVATTNAQGRVTQPKTGGKQYHISAPIPQTDPYTQPESIGQPSTDPYNPPTLAPRKEPPKGGHKRSNTLGNFFRTGSISGPRSQPQSPGDQARKEKRYPPTSMKAPIVVDEPRQSTDSRRPSFGFGRKSSDLRQNSDSSSKEKPRRFSLIPASFSFKSFGSGGGGSKEDYRSSDRRPSTSVTQSPNLRSNPRPQTIAYSRPLAGEGNVNYDGGRDGRSDPQMSERSPNNVTRPRDAQNSTPAIAGGLQQQPYVATPNESEVSLQHRQQFPVYPAGFADDSYEEVTRPSTQPARSGRGVLQKPNRRFADAYDQDQEPGSGHHAGTSGAARRVMDFFRRRGKARTGEERV